MANRFIKGTPSNLNYYSYYAIVADGETADTVVANEAPEDCATGSTLYFVNTGDLYMFYKDTWYKQ